MKNTFNRLALGLASAGMLTLSGCGGGGSSTPAASGDISVTVIDGAIKGALVCLDTNNNGDCDNDETRYTTNDNGIATIPKTRLEDAAKFPLVALIVKGAIDQDRPGTPITEPYTLSAPAGSGGIVTPLTTLVQHMVLSTGQTPAAAAALLKSETGLNHSFLEDFRGNSADQVSAATLARMVVVTTQQQSALISEKLLSRTTDLSDEKVITQTDLNIATQKKIRQLLPTLIEALNTSDVLSAGTMKAKEPLLQAAATRLLSNFGLTVASVATVVAINRQAAGNTSTASPVPKESGSLSRLAYASATDWSRRIHSGTVAQNTVDANGNYRWRQMSTAKTGTGAPYSWGSGSRPDQGNQLHWSGSAWANCPINFENTYTGNDAKGNSTYNYCDGFETGISHSTAVFDVSERPMIDVYNEIRAAGYTNMRIDLAPAALGTAKFPAGSKIEYGSGMSLTSASSYEPNIDNEVDQVSVAVAAGRTNPNDSAAACGRDFGTTQSVTLEGMIATHTGKPCVNGPATVTGSGGVTLSSGPRNESWGNVTLGITTLGDAPRTDTPTTKYYSGNTKIRVAFGSGNTATYYSCSERFNGWTGNCDPISTATYTIRTLGDARVLSFSSVPSQLAGRDWSSTFIERGGRVYYGGQGKPGAYNSANLNLTGMNALFSVLGLPAFDPATPAFLSAASYAGTYQGTFSGGDTGTFSVTMAPTGVTSCSGYSATASGTFVCSFSVVPNLADTSIASITFGAIGTGATFTGTANYYTGAVSGTWTNTGLNGTFSGRRF